MAEYIDREAALESVREKLLITDALPDGIPKDASVFTLASMQHSLESIPAADVRPVMRGHIEEDENTYLFCSECNCNITLAAYETPDNTLVLRPNFCPNCGADMREES